MVLEMLFKVFIFPGFLFMTAYSFLVEYLDRKIYARMQNRVGPPWYQPIADFFKLIGKSEIIPEDANPLMFRLLPLVALASVATAFTYVPVYGSKATSSFSGDIVIVLYFLTMVPLTSFLAGWYSRNAYATIGATRVLTQMFAYEVPLFMSMLAPALIADTWSITEMAAYYAAHPLQALINIPALVVGIISIQCKLERAPFDTPEAETEIVSGVLVEYGGKLLAMFKLAVHCELVLVISFYSAVFLPFFTGIAWVDFILYFVKTLMTLFILILMRATMARLEINNTVRFCWKYLSPVAFAQLIINILVGGVI